MLLRVGGVQPVLRRLADDRCAEGVGDDEPGVGRENLARHLERGGEEQPVAMQPVVHPFLVGAEIRDRRLDLDDPDFAVGAERHEIGAPAGRQRQLAHHRKPERMQEPRGAARDRRARSAIAGRRWASDAASELDAHGMNYVPAMARWSSTRRSRTLRTLHSLHMNSTSVIGRRKSPRSSAGRTPITDGLPICPPSSITMRVSR